MQIIHGIKCGKNRPIKTLYRTNKMIAHMFKKHPGLKYVVDALEPMQIAVTPADVKNGVPLSHTKCAMALACNKTLKADDTFIGIRMAGLKFGDTLIRFTIPEGVRREIVCFDRHNDFDVRKGYRLSAVPGYRQLGRLQQKPKRNGPKQPKRRNGKFLSVKRTAHIRKFSDALAA